jgi:ABC-type uncharacterized transport system ATPase subunit
VIGVVLGEAHDCDLGCYGALMPGENERSENGDGKQYIQVKAEDVTTITAQILRDLPVADLTIEDPPIEDVIKQAFQD